MKKLILFLLFVITLTSCESYRPIYHRGPHYVRPRVIIINRPLVPFRYHEPIIIPRGRTKVTPPRRRY